MRTLVLITLSAVLVVMMIAPNMVGRYPPLQDLPNHLARIHFLAFQPLALTEMFALN